MKNKLKEYSPNIHLQKYIDAYWSFRNNTGNEIFFPVVPDGCNDIIFYLNDSKKLGNLKNTFVSGVMEHAQLITYPDKMELFGIRFKPGILFYFLKNDMKQLTNNMCELATITKNLFNNLNIDHYANDKSIISKIDIQLMSLIQEIDFEDSFLAIVTALIKNPQVSIKELSEKSGFSQKYLQRTFYKRIGLTPKKLARIMRFQKAHKIISNEGLKQLAVAAYDSGYFDQAHFNREYHKLIGSNPSNETMSILYNT